MTQPHEVTVTDADIDLFDGNEEAALALGFTPTEARRQALAAFLAKRVPGALATNTGSSVNLEIGAAFHNALRDAVLKGPQG